jgi:hypothetical protein
MRVTKLVVEKDKNRAGPSQKARNQTHYLVVKTSKEQTSLPHRPARTLYILSPSCMESFSVHSFIMSAKKQGRQHLVPAVSSGYFRRILLGGTFMSLGLGHRGAEPLPWGTQVTDSLKRRPYRIPREIVKKHKFLTPTSRHHSRERSTPIFEQLEALFEAGYIPGPRPLTEGAIFCLGCRGRSTPRSVPR